MHERPYLLVSCAMSVDGYIDDASPARLVLSSAEDLDRVDEVRAGCDAIFVGAGTIRRDDPRLVIRSAARRAGRLARGVPEDPVKVTITATGDLDPSARFFTTGNSARLVYCARPALETTRARLSEVAEVIDAGDSPSPVLVLCDLAERGVASVLLEGGGQLAAEFLAADLADELHLVVAPFFVGDPAAPRFAVPGGYPHGPANRMRLAEVRPLGDVVLLRYRLGTRPDPRPPAEQANGQVGGRAAGPGEASAAAEPGRPGEARGAAESGGPPAAQAPHLAAVPEPGTFAAVHVPQPSRSPEPPSPRAADIRWLRETIERLSVDESVMPPHPSELSSRPSRADQSRANQSNADPDYPARSGGDPDYADRSGGDPDYADRSRGEPAFGDRGYGEPGAPSAADVYWLRETIDLSRRSPPSHTAFSVGAVIVGADGRPLATGFSRETGPRDHAEEIALDKVAPGDPRLAGATMYSSLEPCGVRASRPRPCAELIIRSGLRRVVYAWREPPLLAPGGGDRMLRAAGLQVTEVPELAAEARQVNAHLTGPTAP